MINVSLSPLRRGTAVAWLRRHAAAAAGLLCGALAVCLRLYRLGAQSLWLDEGSTWAEVTRKSWWMLISELWSRDAAYPLYHVLLKAWIGLAGDSEWALRFPSAAAGVGAVVAAYGVACQAQVIWNGAEQRAAPGHRPSPGGGWWPVAVALLITSSPFAIWHAQDAKVYGLLMFVVALLLWAFLRAVRRSDPRAWLLAAGVAVVSVFVHRLALLALAGAALAYVFLPVASPPQQGQGPRASRTGVWRRSFARRWPFAALAAALALSGVIGTILAVRGESRGSGGHIAAGPGSGLWLTLAHFSLDRGNIAGFLGLPLVSWLLPCALLTLWGLVLLARDAWRREPVAIVIACMLAVPLALLAAALAFAPIYEARYATVAFPAWIFVLAYPLGRSSAARGRRAAGIGARFLLAGAVLLVNTLVLVQPQHGLLSGAPVKEQWRAAITYLARQAHPDDLVIIHPYYVRPLWDYYAPRVTPDRLPPPTAFTDFNQGLGLEQANPAEWFRRNYELAFQQRVAGKKRALLLIAPEHARIIDPPDQPQDIYGRVGLQFQYSTEQRAWPCRPVEFVGVHMLCQSYPDLRGAAGAEAIPQPAIPLEATFGGQLHLRGYTLSPFDGVARPGGTLPVTLYWEASSRPSRDYLMFLHLCRDCGIPPLANDDGPPLNGYGDAGHTTTWRVGDPIHDERAVYLPPDLPPGQYTLLLGVYPAGDPSEQARLPVVSRAAVFGTTRLVLGQVEITAP